MPRTIKLMEERTKGTIYVDCHQITRDPSKSPPHRRVWYVVRGYVNEDLVVWRPVRPQPRDKRENNLTCRQRDTTRRVFHALYDLYGSGPDPRQSMIALAQSMDHTLEQRGASKIADTMS